MTDASFDPFQVFEVTHQRCIILYVKILRGRNITKGWAKDLVDTPDPYVILKLENSPNAWRKTSVKDNDIHPVWEETFTFWLDRDQEHTLEMSLMDANYTVDEHLASRSFPVTFPPPGTKMRKTVHFNETSEVDMEIWAEISDSSDLRFSLTLCNEEKRFIETRKRKILKVMKEYFGFAAPRNYREVPVIGIIGSGGGFRAMTAYSGVISALSQLGVLDMTTYVGGLSGSAWYISQLYSHPKWPNVYPGDQREEIRANIDHSFLWLFRSHGLAFVKEVWKKRSMGEPVSFTDLFGHLVGNTLLKNRLDSKLSDQRRVVNDGQCPLPLYTCLHVKKSVSAMIFHEWMEFTPFEVGLPKYGTFMKSDQFSCKFFMGQIIRRFPEPPLHFLQGIWGSAFCIQFKRLLQDDKTVDAGELMRREKEEFEEELKKDMAVCDVADSESSDDDDVHEKGTHGNKTTGGLQRKRSKSTKMKQKTFWDSMLTKMMESRWFQSIELRAAQVFNFMRGLSLNNVFPFSPFTQTQQEEDENNKATFGGIFDLHPTNVKKLYVVDSGLTFNSPYPVVLRPQREVDLILSFDFSARPSDDTPPFKELLLAAKWAELNKVPFPPIDPTIVEREGLRECYVFRHPWDPNCPIVLHFCLVNINFKREIMPGVARKTQEELDFGNFSIFDDPARPYSTFKFTYTHQEFDRLSKLMEYNTLLCKETIFNNISVCIKRRRRFSIRKPCTKKDLSRLSLNSRVKMEKLTEYINMVEKVVGMAEADEKDSTEEFSSSLPIRHLTESPARSRPTSSPIPFLEENGAKGAEEEEPEGDVIKNTKLQRATVSLRAKLVKERPKRTTLWPDMGELKEELEESATSLALPSSDGPPSQRPPGSPKISLTRSRPVSSSMKIFTPTERNTIDREDSLDIDEMTALPFTDRTPNNGHAHHLQPATTLQSLKKSGMTSQNSTDSFENSVQNNGHNGTEQKKKTFPALSLKMAVQEQLSARDAVDAANGHGADGFNTMSGAGTTLDLKPLVDWIDSEERVTDL